jgi:phage host-nuclease inhibitor protein Gam
MKKNTRIKAQPIATRSEFLANVSALLSLEALKRKINGERDMALLKVNAEFDARLSPIVAEIKGRIALAEDYADDHRSDLLPKKDAKSFTTGAARVGWRTGNRTVAQRSGVTVEQAINALKGLGLEAYVRLREEIAKDSILNDCKDDKTLLRPVRDPVGAIVMENGEPKMEAVDIASAGLKISQGESFYIEPSSESAETLTPSAAAAA